MTYIQTVIDERSKQQGKVENMNSNDRTLSHIVQFSIGMYLLYIINCLRQIQYCFVSQTWRIVYKSDSITL